MSVVVKIVCDAPHCLHASTSVLGDVRQQRAKLRKRGWVRARLNDRDADYCETHSNYRTRQ